MNTPTAKKIDEEVMSVLKRCRTEGDVLYLPDEQLDRQLYVAVNKVLETLGGKWNRKQKGHVFVDGDPADLLDNVLQTGEYTDLKKLYQFFPTPRAVAEKMCDMAELDSESAVLEPSCGKGDLADVIYERGVKELRGIELNTEMGKFLSGKPYPVALGVDFLLSGDKAGDWWTRIVMNPPFARQQDIDHILKAYQILAPGGILVSVVSESPFFRENKKSSDFREFLDAHDAEIVRLDAGMFKESGTMVSTRIIKVTKPAAEGQESAAEMPAQRKEQPMNNITSTIEYISVEKLHPHPANPRKDVGDISELSASIKTNGVLQNLTVVPSYQVVEVMDKLQQDPTVKDGDQYVVVIGHRRLAAAKKAKLTSLPCVVVDMTPQMQVKTMLIENMQRTDLTVYEQAQGFQMMLDMGETVESIAKDSGFSPTTVRRRVKLLELDEEKFRKSESRGATISDYLELDKIEDMELKNKVLDTIGTANFRNELKSAIEKEKNRKIIAEYVAEVEKFAERVDVQDWDTMEYVRGYNVWSKSEVVVPEDAETVKYYFTVSDSSCAVYRQKIKKNKKDEEAEKAKKKALEEEYERRISELKEIDERHYGLRKEFISSISKAKAKKFLPEILRFSAFRLIDAVEGFRYDMDYELVAELLDLDVDEEEDNGIFRAKLAEAFAASPEYATLVVAYASIDCEELCYWTHQWYEGIRKPQYNAEDDLDHLYDFLVSIGYEMSDEEKAMQNGNHELLSYAEEK